MTKKIGLLLMLIGCICIIGAGSLFFYNYNEDKQAGEESAQRLEIVKEIIEQQQIVTEQPQVEHSVEISQDEVSEESAEEDQQSSIIINEKYIGYLEIPSLSLTLPVLENWSYTNLKFTPCRQFGSFETNDLVIAGHNYNQHLGKISKLTTSNTITFHDINGAIATYQIANVETISETEAEKVQNNGYDLVLYTCTVSGENRIVVYCQKTS